MTRSQHNIMYQPPSKKMSILYMCLLLLIVITYIGRSNKELTGFRQSATRKGLNSSKESKNDTIKSPGVAIFYNIFAPPNDPEGKVRSYQIIKEQMRQVAESAAVKFSEKVTIYYVSIGGVFNVAVVENVCESLQIECVHVSHHATGYEMITQQAVLDYCKKPGNDMEIVSYIHDKGTFSIDDRQNQNRRMLTKAALSQDCMDRLATDECNVCGFNFKAVWGPTYWGNMWSARCDYVKKLISPFDVYSSNLKAYKEKPYAMAANFYTSKKFALKYSLGEGRFAAEQFISNHPSLIPCSFTRPMDAPNSIWSADPPGDFYSNYVIRVEKPLTLKEIMANDNHLKEWYLLPGMLWRYYSLYKEIPSTESWIWKHYPDGETWKTTIEILGFPNALYNRIESTSILKQKTKSESIDF